MLRLLRRVAETAEIAERNRERRAEGVERKYFGFPLHADKKIMKDGNIVEKELMGTLASSTGVLDSELISELVPLGKKQATMALSTSGVMNTAM